MEGLTTQKYQAMVEEIRATITESVHNSRWILIEGYHEVGKIISESCPPYELSKELQGIAVDVGVSERTLWYALKLYKTYPDLTELPEGKNISWTKLVNNYLSDGKEKTEHFYQCPQCGLKEVLDKFIKV